MDFAAVKEDEVGENDEKFVGAFGIRIVFGRMQSHGVSHPAHVDVHVREGRRTFPSAECVHRGRNERDPTRRRDGGRENVGSESSVPVKTGGRHPSAR